VIGENENHGWVQVGSYVTLDDGANKITYQIVGEQEANPMEQKLSFKSPLGQALLNKPKGASVDIKTLKGATTYKIVEIK